MKTKFLKTHKVVFCFLFSAFCFPLFAQNPNCYRITFSDKNNSPYSVYRPEEFLSQRAIDKRIRFTIPVTEQDLPVNPHYIEAILNFSSEPAQIIAVSKWNNSIAILYPETENCHKIITEMINNFSFVVDTLPVAYYQLPFISDTAKHKDTSTHTQNSDVVTYSSSSCEYDYGNSIDNIKLHNGELLHKADFCGESMLICAFDVQWGGLDTLSYFKLLYENGQILGTRDLVPGVNNVYIGNKNDPYYWISYDHGTSTLSQMAVCIEGQLVGTAPKANYFLIRTESPWGEQLVEEDFYAYGAEIADSLGADVVTASLSYSTFDYEWQNIYTSAHNNGMASIASRAASILAQKGVVVVNSAGNEGTTPWHYIRRPADAFNILAVGMVNKYGVVSAGSSYGPSADGRVKPDVAAPGFGAWIVHGNGTIGQFWGTSFAAPIIAGLSACLWQALPQYSSLEIMQLIREYSSRYNNPNNRMGYGIPDFYQCYLDHYLGVTENTTSSFLVYPNPTTGELRITNYELRITNVEVFDILGRGQKVEGSISTSLNNPRQKAEGEVVMDISHLPAGLYFVQVRTEKSIVTKKIIKL